MELLTATFVAFAVIKNLVKIEYVDDITGERRTETFHRGRYNSRDFTSYRNRKGALEYEWGEDAHKKILRLSLEV